MSIGVLSVMLLSKLKPKTEIGETITREHLLFGKRIYRCPQGIGK
jgi:hypothetical protein